MRPLRTAADPKALEIFRPPHIHFPLLFPPQIHTSSAGIYTAPRRRASSGA